MSKKIYHKTKNKLIETKVSSFLFFMIFFLFFPLKSFALFNDPLGLDLYKKIYDGTYELELKYISKELKDGDQSIGKGLNNFGETRCFREDLSDGEYEKKLSDIYYNRIISYDIIKDECKENGTMDLASSEEYTTKATDYYYQAKLKAETKVQKNYEIGRVGLFTDGIKENSPFDLSEDIKDINSIIFEENIPYNGVNKGNLDDQINSRLKGTSNEEIFNSLLYDNSGYNLNYVEDSENKLEPIVLKSIDKSLNSGNKYACNINDSGLKNESVLNITQNLEKNESNIVSNTNNNQNSNNNQNNIYPSFDGKYSQKNDNNSWGGNGIFDIKIDFIIRNYDLLIGGKNLSIEGLIKRSNGHIKKFTNTSLVQSKMSINNFEIGLKDLNLPDMFHIGVKVETKPVPIINVVNKPKVDNTDFTGKNILRKYYENIGINYDRLNDLSNIDKNIQKRKTISDSEFLTIPELVEKGNQIDEINKKLKDINKDFGKMLIEPQLKAEEIEQFYKEFIELSSFISAMRDYTYEINGIIRGMNGIPKSGGN